MNRLSFLFTTVRTKGTYIHPHQHECFEFVYYYSGKGRTEMASSVFSFQPDTFALMAPHIVHDEIHTEDSEVMVIGFHGERLDTGSISGVYEDSENRAFRGLMDRMRVEFGGQKDGYTEMLDLLIGEMLIMLRRILGLKSIPHPSEDKLLYARNFMDEHFQQKINVSTLAEMSGYSYDRFRHLFKEMNGVAPLQYLFVKRMELARSLLIHSKASVSEIALEAGFVNDAQFCSMFKRETGETPRGYRNRHA
ncbi:MAG: AraC family transcriptional regulator [Paenibacillus sp.]|jgi:AraC family transcriptional activator of pobA|nr:AraC family transcriptional regulator [Paenibacillus sp.]